MSPQVEKLGANAERLIWRRLLFALFVLLVPFADCPVNSDPQLAGIFDNSDDFDDDFDEISLNHVGQAVANQAEPYDPPVAHHVGFTSAVSGPALAAWPGLSPDERAPPRV
jgi:hypothetical protein